MSFLRFDRKGGLIVVWLASNRRVGGRVAQTRYGSLGRVPYGRPLSIGERATFWANIDRKWAAICARHEAVAPEDRGRVFAAVAEKIAFPHGPIEERALKIERVRASAISALDALDDDLDALLAGVPMADDEAEALIAEAEAEATEIVAEANARLRGMKGKGMGMGKGKG
jgi:hypothetical protein